MQVPNHIGVIIDGNRRWATARGMKPWEGHWHGGETLDSFLDWCLELDIPQISVYTLSTENLKRPKKELLELFKVYYEFLCKLEKKKGSLLDKYEVNVRFIGDLSKLPPKLLRVMRRLMERTAKYQKKFLNLLVAYGSQYEITSVIEKLAKQIIKLGNVTITPKMVEEHLVVQTPVDLVIRTGGMSRLSNFMLWQTAYAEVYFTKTLWPDFTKKELIKAINWYNSTRRNFGK